MAVSKHRKLLGLTHADQLMITLKKLYTGCADKTLATDHGVNKQIGIHIDKLKTIVT